MTIRKSLLSAFALALVTGATLPLTAAAQTTPAPAPAQPQMPAAPGAGMMGGGMMMDRDQMMPMMGMMGRHGHAGMHHGMMFRHIEGHLAFLRTELKITEAQMPQWNAFAEAARAAVATMRSAHEAMRQADRPATVPERLARREQMLTARLEALRQVKEPAGKLYAALSDEQKQIADSLMSPMGMGRH